MTRGICINPQLSISPSELRFVFTRSQGPGGQNVNKLSTRVELLFDVNASLSLGEEQKAQLHATLANRIDSIGVLHIAVQKSRSQWRNREDAIERFAHMLHRALMPRKIRTPTKISSSAKRERLAAKKRRSRAKKGRGRIQPDE